MSGIFGKYIGYRCPQCDGDNLVWEARAYWDELDQLFRFDELVEDRPAWCYNCYEAVEAKEVKIGKNNQTANEASRRSYETGTVG